MESESIQHKLRLLKKGIRDIFYQNYRDDPKYICAVGFEPNPNHAATLQEIEESYAKCGWRAHFLTKTAVSNYTGTTQFYTDNAMGYKVG